jgi:hypothetical protein
MFAQGSVPFAQAPNLVAPRIVFQLLGARAGLQLRSAKCPVLLVVPLGDDLIPSKIATDIAASAPDSR